MQVKRYSKKQIEIAWTLFKKRVVYRALVAGAWNVFTDIKEARAAKPLKIEAKFAKDAMEFTEFLDTLTVEAID
jgi:hypothetical protein